MSNESVKEHEVIVKPEEKELLRKSRQLALDHHATIQHPYLGISFMDQVDAVAKIAVSYLDKVVEAQKANVMAASYIHLLMQYCGKTYTEIRAELNQDIAEIILLITPLRGKNRKEQQSVEYYRQLDENPAAKYLKLCIRLANAEAAMKSKSKMFAVYYSEMEEFISFIKTENSDEMIEHYRNIFKELNEI